MIVSQGSINWPLITDIFFFHARSSARTITALRDGTQRSLSRSTPGLRNKWLRSANLYVAESQNKVRHDESSGNVRLRVIRPPENQATTPLSERTSAIEG